MRGTKGDKLWTIDKTKPIHSINTTIGNPIIAERIKFYHASLFSMTLAILTNAIDAGYLTTFPEFTTKQVNRYPPSLLATHKGHLKSQKQGPYSTNTHTTNNFKPSPVPTIPNITEDDYSAQAPLFIPAPVLHLNDSPQLIPPDPVPPAPELVPAPVITTMTLGSRYSDAT